MADPTEVAYYLSNGIEQTALRALAEVASARYTIERCIQEAKGETGLDHYQVRHWHSWHRHITLSMMAHAFLVSLRVKAGEIASSDPKALPKTNISGKKRRARPLRTPAATIPSSRSSSATEK